MATPINAALPTQPKNKNFFGKITQCLTHEKTKKIGLEILKPVACAIIGVCLGAMLFTPISVTMMVFGSFIGAGVGLSTYFAVYGVMHVLKQKGYPAHPFCTEKPIGVEKIWHNDESYEFFKDVVKDRFLPHPWYKAWRATVDDKIEKDISSSCLKHFPGYAAIKRKKKINDDTIRNSDSKAAGHLFSLGANANNFFGDAQVLVKESKTHPELKDQAFVRRILREEVFHRQCLDVIRKDLREAGEAEHADAVDLLSKDIPGVVQVESVDLSFDKTFKKTLKDAMGKARYATLHLSKVKKSHTLYLEWAKDSYRFYDPYSPRHGGLHEGFKDENEFMKALFKNLKAYQSRWRPGTPGYERGVLQTYN